MSATSHRRRLDVTCQRCGQVGGATLEITCTGHVSDGLGEALAEAVGALRDLAAMQGRTCAEQLRAEEWRTGVCKHPICALLPRVRAVLAKHPEDEARPSRAERDRALSRPELIEKYGAERDEP